MNTAQSGINAPDGRENSSSTVYFVFQVFFTARMQNVTAITCYCSYSTSIALSDGSIVSEHRRIQTDTACRLPNWFMACNRCCYLKPHVALPTQQHQLAAHPSVPGHFAALLFEDNESAPSLLLDL